MLYTSFKALQKAGLKGPAFEQLANKAGGVERFGWHTPLPMNRILDHVGLDITAWVLTACPVEGGPAFVDEVIRHYMAEVAPLIQQRFPNAIVLEAVNTLKDGGTLSDDTLKQVKKLEKKSRFVDSFCLLMLICAQERDLKHFLLAYRTMLAIQVVPDPDRIIPGQAAIAASKLDEVKASQTNFFRDRLHKERSAV